MPRPCQIPRAAAGALRRLAFGAVLAALPLALLAALPGAAPPDRPVHAQSGGHADLLVDFADGRVALERLPVSPGMTGLDLLEAAALPVVRSGNAVCAIGGAGCPASDCFCGCREPASECVYWTYFHGRPDGGWVEAQTGPAEHGVAAGDLEGWVWAGGHPPITATQAWRGLLLGAQWLAADANRGPEGGILDHVGFTSEAAFGTRGAGLDLADWRKDGRSPVDFLAAEAGPYSAGGVDEAGKSLAGIAAAGLDPRLADGVDLAARVRASYDPATGRFGTTVWDQAWSLIGLAALGEPLPALAAQALAEAAAPGGGWGFAWRAEAADVDSTGLALQAIRAAGVPVTATVLTRALAFLEAEQQADGGWGHGGPSNVNSSAYAVQGLLAAGEDPAGPRWTHGGPGGAGGPGPMDFLLSTQRPEGRFGFDQAPADLVASLQVLPALAGRPLPLPGLRAGAERAADWILQRQGADGAFEGFNPGATIDAVLALAAWGRDPDQPGPAGPSAADYLAGLAADYAGRGPSAAGKLAAGAVALGADPRDFGGVDLVARVLAGYDAGTGSFGAGGTWDQAWAILGLAAAGEPLPAAAAGRLEAIAAAGGGWGFEAGAASADVDSTGLALQALATAGGRSGDPAVAQGIRFLRRSQRADGGFPGFGGGTEAASTALAVGGLEAFGQAVDGTGWMRGGEGAWARHTPREAILARQSPRGGFAGFGGPDDPMSSYAALLGLSARPLPIRADPRLYLPLVMDSHR